MTQIDPNIALSGRPLQIESPVNQMAAMAQLQNLQQQQQLNALKMQEAQNATLERNALLQTISAKDFDLNNPTHVQKLLRKAPTLGMPYVKEARMAAAEKAKSDREQVQAEHEKFKMRKEQLDFTNTALQNSTNPTLARAHIQQAIDLKYVSPEAGTQMLASVPEDPTEFDAWRANLLSHSMTAKDQLERAAPKMEKVDLNGVIKHIDVNPNSPTYGKEILPEMVKTPSESDLARFQRERATIAKDNPNDPRLEQYDAAIAKLTTPAEHLSDLARKQSELEKLEADLAKDPNNKKLQQRVKEYKNDIRKDTEWKPPVLLMQAQAGPKPTDTTLDMLAAAFIEDKNSINAVPKAMRMAIMNRASEMLGSRGLTGEQAGKNLIEYRIDTKSREAAIKDFNTGKTGTVIRALNTATDHLSTLDKATVALENNDTRLFNLVGNTINKQMGVSAPTDFEGVKTIVGSELAKAVAGNTNALQDREEIRAALSQANSPAQLRSLIKYYKQLMAGQFKSLKTQYESSTGRTNFNEKLSPEVLREMSGTTPNAPRAMTAEDKKALDWANANPTDPRAAKIKQRLGVTR